MPFGKQGRYAAAPTSKARIGKKPGGKVVGHGMVAKTGARPKGISAGGKKPR
jgi:hypothetical protein